MCGVPLIRNGGVCGVLVIQNREHRNYVDDEIETLETIAMVVAELVMSSDPMQALEATTEETRLWTVAKDEMLRRLDQIRANIQEIYPLVEQLEDIRPERGIGDNFPPEPINEFPLSLEKLQQGQAAVNILSDQLERQMPELNVVQLCTMILRELSLCLARFIRWLGSLGKDFLENFAKSAGKQAGKAITPAIYLYSAHEILASSIVGNLETLTRWLMQNFR